MPKVGIVMGSDSDMKVMGKAADMLEKFGIDYEMTIISAHREPDVFYEYAKSAEAKGLQSNYCRCRYGSTSSRNVCSDFPDAGYRNPNVRQQLLEGVDSLYSIVQMPPGIPVATVAINGGANAAYSGSKDSCNLRS